MDQNDLAFSNPIYGQVIEPSLFRPVPKPRLSKKKSLKAPQNLPDSDSKFNPNENNDNENDHKSNLLISQQQQQPKPINTKSILYTQIPNQQQDDSTKRSSSLCLGDIRMTQLLEEINRLTDSLQKNYSSAPDNVDQQQKEKSSIDEQEQDQVTRRIFKKKRIPVKSDLMDISFDDDIHDGKSPELSSKEENEIKTKNNPVSRSADSGVFLTVSQKSVNDDNDDNNNNNNDGEETELHLKILNKNIKDSKQLGEIDEKKETQEEGEPPKLPPRKPLRIEVVPKMDPIKSFEEHLNMEHLHNDTLSLQRSGYLWKTGPNYRSFKNRWCVLYRHSQNYFDANISYYFNRSSMSASLSGKILLAEIEFISIADTIPAKTRLPKIEKVNSTSSGISNSNVGEIGNDSNNQSLCFFDIGVKSRQGRVYLFAARSDSDRQLWIHAFVQAITLHAFKNKEIYQCGFIRAKFTITAIWQNCFAILTTDRFFYLFELEQDNPIPTLDCQRYHIFNLRKTIRLSRLGENSMSPAIPATQSNDDGNSGSNAFGTAVGGGSSTTSTRRKSTDSSKENCWMDCRFGFSLTQNGGHVVYLLSIFEQHINLWYRSIWRFWLTPKQPAEKLILEEQYLTKENVPVAFDKCIKFLDTFNQTGLNLFGPMQDSMHETVISKDPMPSSDFSSSDKSSNDSNIKARVPFLPSHPASKQMIQHHSNAIIPGDMDLLTQQKLLQKLLFDSWNVHLLPQKYNACQISQLLLLYLRSMNECLFTEQLLQYWIKLSSLVDNKMDEINSKTKTDDQSTSMISFKLEQMKRLLKLMPPVNYCTLRRFIIYLYNATENKEEYYLSTSLCKTLFFSKQQNKSINSMAVARSLLLSMIQNHVWLFDVTQDELEKELQIKRVVNLIISQNRKENAKKQHQLAGGGGQRLAKMIRSRTTAGGGDHLLVKNKHSHQHLNDSQKVNSLILSIKVMVINSKDKKQNQNVNVHINRNTTANDLFEMMFEKIKPENPEEILNNYSVFEIICNRRLERIIMGKERILPLVLHWSNWPSYWSSDACIEIKPTEQLLKSQARNIKIHLPSLNVIRFENESLNYTPIMLMSVIRYCSQSDARLVKHILAEFSSSQLFLYCKETHHLLGQFGLDDIYWYIGSETGNIVQYGSVKCKSIVNDDDDVHSATMVYSTGSNKSRQQQHQQQSTTADSTVQSIVNNNNVDPNNNGDHYGTGIPALTFIERHRIKFRQSQERRNFGHTLVFNSWTELDQWIKGLLEASFYKELFAI